MNKIIKITEKSIKLPVIHKPKGQVVVLVAAKETAPLGSVIWKTNIYTSGIKHKYQIKRIRMANRKIEKILRKLDHDVETFRYWRKK